MSNVKFDFKGKTVVVTGASRGIGLAIAKAFLESGARVINISKSAQNKKDKPNCTFVQIDVKDINKVKNWIEDFTKDNKIDIFVNNAGICTQHTLLNVNEKEWDEIFSTNVKSLFFFSTTVAGHMKENREGVIINASSFACLIPSIGRGVYAASKAAVASLTKSMAAEWAPYGIRVNSYCPGLIETDMNKEIIAKNKDKALEPIALSRAGKPEDVAGAVLFLCSDDASYITGEEISITGGKFIVQNQSEAGK